MKLAATVILYKPEEIGMDTVKANIQSYAFYSDIIYVVDNSPEETMANRELASSIGKCVYIYNGNKGGIAGAQNKACRQAIKDGYEWLMTMDQDSIFEPEQIKTYMHLVETYIPTDEKAVSFGPQIKNMNQQIYWTKQIRFKILSPIKRKILGKRWKPRQALQKPVLEFPEGIIASSNIIKLSAWEEVGGFDEFLFIDEVDLDFCHKLKRLGYRIVKFRDAYLTQFYGAKTFSILPKYFGKYSPFRLYYIFRNMYIQRYRFPEYKARYDDAIMKRFYDSCINTIHPIRNFRIFLKARKDAKEFIHGEINVMNIEKHSQKRAKN